jgi:hypothetical protein
MEVHEKGWPRSGLMLRDGSDDWNVPVEKVIRDIQLYGAHHQLFGISSVPQRIKSSGPRCDPPFIRESNDGQCTEETSCDYAGKQELLELLGRYVRPNKLYERNDLQKTENT